MAFAESISVTSDRYTIGGKEFPRLSVVTSQHTNIHLEEWKKRVGEEEAERIANEAAEYGDLVHEMTAYEDLAFELGHTPAYHDLDKILNGEPWLIPHWVDWREWKREYVKKIVEVEIVVWSNRYWCAGKIDRVLEMVGERSLSIGDLKTGSLSDDFGIDLAGYQYMWNERSKRKSKRRLVVHMPRKEPGKLRVKEYSDPNDVEKWKEMCRDYEMANGG